MILEQCDDLTAPANGSVSVDKKPGEFTAKYSCEAGFSIVGGRTRWCEPKSLSGRSRWIPSKVPICEGKEDLFCCQLQLKG